MRVMDEMRDNPVGWPLALASYAPLLIRANLQSLIFQNSSFDIGKSFMNFSLCRLVCLHETDHKEPDARNYKLQPYYLFC